MPGRRTLTLATRGSELALAQTREVQEALAARFGEGLELRVVTAKTSGDVLEDAALRDFGGKGAFVKEVDERVLAGKADVAVHSLKDVPTKMHADLVVAAVLARPAFTDALVAETTLAELPRNARIGTSSVRRRAMLLRARPDLAVTEIRGNVPTRVEKWRRGEYEGVALSTAGLRRLRIDAPYRELDPAEFVPEPGQGAVACVCGRDSPVGDLLRAIDDAMTRAEVEVERRVLRSLDAGCVAPVGVHATRARNGLSVHVHATILSLDGRRAVTLRRTIRGRDAMSRADGIARDLLRMGGDVLLKDAREGG